MPEVLSWRTGEPPSAQPWLERARGDHVPYACAQLSGQVTRGDWGAKMEAVSLREVLGACALSTVYRLVPWHCATCPCPPLQRAAAWGHPSYSELSCPHLLFFQTCKWRQPVLILPQPLHSSLVHVAGPAPFHRSDSHSLISFSSDWQWHQHPHPHNLFYWAGQKAKQMNKESTDHMPGVLYTISILMYLSWLKLP